METQNIYFFWTCNKPTLCGDYLSDSRFNVSLHSCFPGANQEVHFKHDSTRQSMVVRCAVGSSTLHPCHEKRLFFLHSSREISNISSSDLKFHEPVWVWTLDPSGRQGTCFLASWPETSPPHVGRGSLCRYPSCWGHPKIKNIPLTVWMDAFWH